MKHKLKSKLGKFLMKLNMVNIAIVDDEDAYFNENMLETANNSGFTNIDRFNHIDQERLNQFQINPYDIIILDVKGIVDENIAKNGLHVASILHKTTETYIVITSSHQFHLNNRMMEADYYIEDRLLTNVDFVNEIIHITEDFISKKTKFYQKILFKYGFKLLKATVN